MIRLAAADDQYSKFGRHVTMMVAQAQVLDMRPVSVVAVSP